MDTGPVYISHDRALTLLFADLERQVLSQRAVLLGSAGSVIERTNAGGFRFYAHQFYGADGKRREHYLAGPVGAGDAEAAAEKLRLRIVEVNQLARSLRILRREGFAFVDPRTYAAVASLHNHGVFRQGALLIGSHAYGVLLNRMGVRAAPYATEDVDIARAEKLLLQDAPPFLEMLRDSGLPFVEVPGLRRKDPATSFMQPGKSRLHVDLLVPWRDESFPIVAVPELQAHATGLPHLAYLLAESQLTMLAARVGACAVRVPLPERFAVHKLLVSQLRRGRQAKTRKDLDQAAVLAAALAENFSGALEDALAAVPRRARKCLGKGLRAVAPLLRAHPRALEELGIESVL